MRTLVAVLALFAFAVPLKAQIDVQPDTVRFTSFGERVELVALPVPDVPGWRGWWQRRAARSETTYRSLDPAIASATESGTVLAIADGVALVVGELDGFADTTVVVVGSGVVTPPDTTTGPPPSGHAAYPGDAPVLVGDTLVVAWTAPPEHVRYTVAQMDTLRAVVTIWEQIFPDGNGEVLLRLGFDSVPGFLRIAPRDSSGAPIAADRIDIPFAGIPDTTTPPPPPPPPPPPTSGPADSVTVALFPVNPTGEVIALDVIAADSAWNALQASDPARYAVEVASLTELEACSSVWGARMPVDSITWESSDVAIAEALGPTPRCASGHRFRGLSGGQVFIRATYHFNDGTELEVEVDFDGF